MRPPGVVMGAVRGKHLAQVPLTEDQHQVGDLGPHCQDEAFGVLVVRPGTPGRDLDHFDARVRHAASNDAVNWPAGFQNVAHPADQRRSPINRGRA